MREAPHLRRFRTAGAAGLEPATPGFGDRCATNCATPLGCAGDCTRRPAADRRAPGGPEYAPTVQRRALGVLFATIAVSLALMAVWSALAGGRAWVIAFAAAALALWMGDLARRVWPW
jgi:hypothetical protein